MENALFNQHILETIFDYCKVATLLQCRLVCKLWESESSRILRRKAKIILATTEDMTNLSTSLDSYIGPFSTFLIQFLSEDQSPVIHQILDKSKTTVRHLNFQYQPITVTVIPTIEDDDNNEPAADTKQQQFESELVLPLVESLHLFSTQFAPSQETLCMPQLFENLNLPRLSSLTVIHLHDTTCTDTIIKLIGRCGRPLEKLKIPCIKLMDIIQEINLEELKELDLCELFHGSVVTNQILTSLIASCPKLTRLSIELSHRVTNQYIMNLFLAFSRTLEFLKLTIQDKVLLSRSPHKVDLQFPIMHKLKVLSLRFSNPGLNYFIDNIPQLYSLELDTPWQRKVRGEILPAGGVDKKIYAGLSVLKLSETLTVTDVENISNTFPNLKILGCSFENNEALFKVYEKLTSLQRMLIERRSNISDAGICGISDDDMEIIAAIYLQCNSRGGRQDVVAQCNSLRQATPFIGNLKNLKTLEFCQRGLTWISLIFGVFSVQDLRTLTIQTTTLKFKSKVLTENPALLFDLKESLPMLASLTLWIRHHDEKLNGDEGNLLQKILSPTDVNILGTICSV